MAAGTDDNGHTSSNRSMGARALGSPSIIDFERHNIIIYLYIFFRFYFPN